MGRGSVGRYEKLNTASNHGFKPYKSRLISLYRLADLSMGLATDTDSDSGPAEPVTFTDEAATQHADPPPWRLPLGHAWFLLDSQFSLLYGEDLKEGEDDEYARLVSRAFDAFSTVKVGSDMLVELGEEKNEEMKDTLWEIDSYPAWGLVPDQVEVSGVLGLDDGGVEGEDTPGGTVHKKNGYVVPL